MGLKYLLDTTLIIDHLNQVAPATEFLFDNVEECCISVVTLAEVLVRPEPDGMAELLLAELPILPIDALAARFAAEFRKQYKFKLPDAFQAGLARSHKLKLVTRNTRDFDPKKFPFVHVPYRTGA
jgi:predicted nucleic acid-binding protein